jgi:hypothetical protein
MPIKLNSSGGGSVTLDVPSTGSTFTLTAPARTGNIITSGDSGTISSGMIASGAVTTSLIAAGSAGQSLTTNSSGATAWIDGGRTLIETLTASNSPSLGTTNCFTSTYRYYEIIFENIIPATTNSHILARVYSGGAYQTASYIYGQMVPSNYTWSASAASAPIAWVTNGLSNSTTLGGMSGYLRVFNPTNTSVNKGFVGSATYYHAGNGVDLATVSSFRWTGGTGSVTGFQIFINSGNITSGIVKIYGWN